MFIQGPDKSFCETWEMFKVTLKRYPYHGFEDIAQLNIFHNDLTPDTKMLLNIALTLTSIDYQAHNDTQVVQKKVNHNPHLL